MGNLTISNILRGAKNPTLVSAGIMGGICIQKMLNKVLNSDAVVDGLGDDTVLALKNYASPAITTALGIAISMTSEDDTIKKLGTGVAISGPLNVGMQLLWNKNLLAGLNDGVIGGLLGGDIDYDDDDDDDYVPQIPASSTPVAGFDLPLANPAIRDTPWEKETMAGTSDSPLIF